MDGSVTCDSSLFPTRLAGLRDAPKRLFWRGPLAPTAGGYWVAIVGARAATGASLELAGEMARSLAESGAVVVSGGALGVDAAAHRGALAATGHTVAVLGAGLAHLYPAVHRPMFATIADSGALVSPFEHDVPPRRFHFVRRNRIIAGLCDAVIVVEASRSSGALYTANAARDYGRRLAAVPGSPGCEALIASGAFPMTDAREVVGFASGLLLAPTPTLPTDDLERAVLRSLGGEPVGAEALAHRLGSSAREVDRALAGLELLRLALAMPGREYVRSALGEAIRS